MAYKYPWSVFKGSITYILNYYSIKHTLDFNDHDDGTIYLKGREVNLDMSSSEDYICFFNPDYYIGIINTKSPGIGMYAVVEACCK